MTRTVSTEPDAPEPASVPETPTLAADALKLALRRARYEDAERAGARAELRAARLGRLELLQDALQPLLAQIPSDVDMFDVALAPSSNPRLFIDMIGFVEMGRDAHLYVLQQDTRHGRIRVAETASLEAMVDAVTDYVARRLLERDKALVSDAKARSAAGAGGGAAARARFEGSSGEDAYRSSASRRRRRRSASLWAIAGFAFLIDLLGAIAFFALLGSLAWYVWTRTHVGP